MARQSMKERLRRYSGIWQSGRFRMLLTLLIGLSGSVLAWAVGLPAAPLIGSTGAAALGAFVRVTSDVPQRLRDVAFILIGCSLGSGFTKDALREALHWPISLVALALSVLLILFCCSRLLTSFFKQTVETAALATSPGALAYSLSLAASGVGDARTIVVVQSIRLFLITTLLPFVIRLVDSAAVAGHAVVNHPPTTPMTSPELLFTACAALLVSWPLIRMKLPAAYLLAGLLVSSIAHFYGLVGGRPPAFALFLGFTITGTVIGARFSSIPLVDIKRLLGASLGVLLLSLLISAAFAIPTAWLLHIPYNQVFIAFAPGGVEAMAVMAITLGYDPAYVTIHHLFRLFLLMAVLPLIFQMERRRLRHQASSNDPGSSSGEQR